MFLKVKQGKQKINGSKIYENITAKKYLYGVSYKFL